MSWCASTGGKANKGDLVKKLSRLGASGAHVQNAERDLQRTISSFGYSLRAKIDTIRVHLWDPKDSCIYEADLPASRQHRCNKAQKHHMTMYPLCSCSSVTAKVIFPDEFARAVWDLGKDVFEQVYLGTVGKAGATEYWANARDRCVWYPPSIPEDCHSGLIPVSIYGDEVHAYRNTDPGAVSVVGWGSDLSFGIEAMLQYGLICVYSEYCECESTYGDIMEAVLPRFQYLCDPHAPHPWKDEFRFLLCGVRGDLKWINDKYKIHNYRLNDFCSRCSCVKNADNVYETITAFGDQAQHVPVSNSSFCDSLCIDEWPWPMRYGVHLERFCHDTCHSQLLGSGKCLNGSALTYLCEQGYFHGGQFGSGVYDVELQIQLQFAYSDFRSWAKAAGLKIHHPRFTFNRLNRKHRGMQPCFMSDFIIRHV